MKSLVAVVGPTAVGKTEASLKLARKLDGEIVNADSRQVYRYMDIGTAKPTPEEQAVVPHHLFDIINPDEDFSLALYQNLALQTIGEIHSRNKTPVLVGGSGQYVWSILEGWSVPEIPPDDELRQRLEERAETEGSEALYRELQELDLQATEQIDSRNVRRIIRALEVCKLTGKRFSDLKRKNPPDFEIRIAGVTVEREELYERIDQRVDRMIARGFVAEVRELLEKGYSMDLPAMSSLGYREIAAYIKGEIDLSEAAQQIKYATHRFARHQYGWFRLKDERITWFGTGQEIGF